jgi:glycosyltransferase involved in cell wall biosynthesis
MKLAVWSPLPPAPSGIADYVAETLPYLARHFELTVVVEDLEGVTSELPAGARLAVASADPQADLDLYHVGNSPSHAYVYRQAISKPGVAFLHDWCLHHVVLKETVERGDALAYVREMRRSYGSRGSFVGRQVARGLGGNVLPTAFPLNDRVLDTSLGIVGLSGHMCRRGTLRQGGRSVLRLRHHLSLCLDPLPSQAQARRSLGLPQDALIVTAPGLATVSKRLETAIGVVGQLRREHPGLRLVVAGGSDPALPLETWRDRAGLGSSLTVTGRVSLEDFVRHLVAADVILALRYPSHGEMSGALVRAMGVGRPCLVTAGTPAAAEFPRGTMVPVDPGPHERAELQAVLEELLAHPALRQDLGRLAREHVRKHHGLEESVESLASFLVEVEQRKPELVAAWATRQTPTGGLLELYSEELHYAARDMGLHDLPPELHPLLADLADPRRSS